MQKVQPPVDQRKDQDQEIISCEVCMKSVPKSGSKSAETVDYVAHFCGIECYKNWINQAENNKKDKS